MSRVIVVSLLMIFSAGILPAQNAAPDTVSSKIQRSLHDRLFAPDKGHHFMASAFLAGFSYYAMRQEMNASATASNNAAIGISFSIGIAKEVYDGMSGRGTPSLKDILADAAGIAAAILILNAS